MSHTKGPWQAKAFCSPPDTYYVVDSEGQLLVGAAKKIEKDDALLIAAAPALLAAAKAALPYVEQAPLEGTIPIADALRQAIEQAEGE